MPIRPATYTDLLPASHCLAQAFSTEELFGLYMHPHQPLYPQDMYLHFLHTLRLAYVSGPDHHLLISYTTDPKTSQEKITGLAHWTRFRAKTESSYVVVEGKKKVIEWYNYFESWIYPNRAAEASRTNLLGELYPYIQHFWTSPPHRSEVYDLTLLGVAPSASGLGHGSELIAWGFEQAKREGVGCSVIGAKGTEEFYKRKGFDVKAGWAGEKGGKENPLVREGIEGGMVMFWDNGRGGE